MRTARRAKQGQGPPCLPTAGGPAYAHRLLGTARGAAPTGLLLAGLHQPASTSSAKVCARAQGAHPVGQSRDHAPPACTGGPDIALRPACRHSSRRSPSGPCSSCRSPRRTAAVPRLAARRRMGTTSPEPRLLCEGRGPHPQLLARCHGRKSAMWPAAAHAASIMVFATELFTSKPLLCTVHL